MNDLTVFKSFAKGVSKQAQRTSNCVIYTRVSTKEQADNNMSLETQRKLCEQFAKKHNYIILGDFGGTYESAQTDERKEFNSMLSFVRKCREKISFIIVYSVDRFSRSGANAIYLKETLRTQGVSIVSVTQQTDTTTSSGNLQQNIQFIFSEYDNQLRREKCMTGVKESLLRGEWCHRVPMGYDSIRLNGKRKIVVNETGKLIRKAFIWKSEEQMSNLEIRKRLSERGMTLSKQQITKIFNNPFYCGIITQNSLEGQIIEGSHEKLISKEMFMTANNVYNGHSRGYKISHECEHIPLKRFIKCDECGAFMRGYLVRKKNIYYYKCNNGCSNNKNADSLHRTFAQILQPFTLTINAEMTELFKKQMTTVYKQLTTDKQDDKQILNNQLSEVNKKLNRIEERFIEEDINRELYIKYIEKYRTERNEIETKIADSSKQVSNLEECIEKAITISSNLAPQWASASYSVKQRIQFLLFPEGIRYNKKNDRCRTERINSVFAYIACLAQDAAKQQNGIQALNLDYNILVEMKGFEPTTPTLPAWCSSQLSYIPNL